MKSNPNPDFFRIEDETNLVWRFPLEISQSSLAGKQELSNACTLIALKIAEILHNHRVFMSQSFYRQPGGREFASPRREFSFAAADSPRIPSAIFAALVNGIIDGNEAYASDAGDASTRVYNLPDAIKACGTTFAEIDFKLCHARIAAALPRMIRAAIRCPAFLPDSRLVFVIIGSIRTVLLIYERVSDSLTLFDTHMHLLYDVDRNENIRHGAIIATSKMCHVSQFATWIEHHIFPDILTSSNGEFEISLVKMVMTSSDSATQKLCDVTNDVAPVGKLSIFHEIQEEEPEEPNMSNDENNNIIETNGEAYCSPPKTFEKTTWWRRIRRKSQKTNKNSKLTRLCAFKHFYSNPITINVKNHQNYPMQLLVAHKSLCFL